MESLVWLLGFCWGASGFAACIMHDKLWAWRGAIFLGPFAFALFAFTSATHKTKVEGRSGALRGGQATVPITRDRNTQDRASGVSSNESLVGNTRDSLYFRNKDMAVFGPYAAKEFENLLKRHQIGDSTEFADGFSGPWVSFGEYLRVHSFGLYFYRNSEEVRGSALQEN